MTSTRTKEKTPFERISLLLSDVLIGLLPTDGPDIVGDEAYVGFRENVFSGRCLVMANISGSAIPAQFHSLLFVCRVNSYKASKRHRTV
jgi:hypothetical protein